MDATGTPVGRRVFLGMVATGAAGIVVGGRVQDFLSRLVEPIVEKDATGLSGFFPVGRFRIYTAANYIPHKRPADYRLKITGLVDTPTELTFDQLKSLRPFGLTRDFQCVTGWRVRDVKWKGVRLSDLLGAAGVKAGATAVTFGCFDKLYTESLTVEQARTEDVMVAYELEGKPITDEHGGPVRLYVPRMYGYKSAKWLDRIEVTRTLEPGYWEVRGYDQHAYVGRSNGRDDPAI